MLLTLIRPFLVYIVGAALVAAVAGGLYFKVRHDGATAALQKVETEKRNAVKKVKKAQDRVITVCNVDPANCVPDDWYRD